MRFFSGGPGSFRSLSARASHLVLLLTLILSHGAAHADEEDIIRLATGNKTLTLDPIGSIFDGAIESFGLLYSRLLRRGLDGSLQPGLATHWDVSADGRVYTFYLRPARFSNGSPITADDVVFSMLRMRDDPEAAYSEPVQGVVSAVAVDPRTLRVTLAEPGAAFLDALEMCYFGVVSKADVEKRGKQKAFTSDVVTSGPYRVTHWNRQERMVLEANPHYWREGYPKNDGVEIIVVSDVNTRVAMLLAGEVDALQELPWFYPRSLDKNPDVVIPVEPATVIWIVILNHDQPPFDDIRVRQAAALALDREAIARSLARGIGRLANTTLPDTIKYHHSEYPGWPYDPERARRLIEEAGAAGSELVLITTPQSPQINMIALVVQEQWAKIGLKLRIDSMDQGLSEQRQIDGDYHASVNWWLNEFPDPDLALKWAVCGSCGNRSYYSNYLNEEVDRLLARGAHSMDPLERRAIYHRVQEITTSEVAQIPLFYPRWLNAYSTGIEGLRMTPAMQWTMEEARHVR